MVVDSISYRRGISYLVWISTLLVFPLQAWSQQGHAIRGNQVLINEQPTGRRGKGLQVFWIFLPPTIRCGPPLYGKRSTRLRTRRNFPLPAREG